MTTNTENESEALAQTLAACSAVEIRTDRICRIIDRHQETNPVIARTAAALCQKELEYVRENMPEPINDATRFLTHAAQENLLFAQRRATPTLPTTSDPQETELQNQPPEILNCITYIADAAQIQHHANQAANNINTVAKKAHMKAGIQAIERTREQSEETLDMAIRLHTENAVDDEFINQMVQASQEIVQHTATIEKIRRSHMTSRVLPVVESINPDAAFATIEAFREDDRPIGLNFIQAQNGAISIVITFEQDDTIHAKLATEPYPLNTPVETVIQHAMIIAEQIDRIKSNNPERDDQIIEVLRQTANLMTQSAQAGIHCVDLMEIADMLDMAQEMGADPGLTRNMIDVVSRGRAKLSEQIEAATGHNNIVTSEQGQIIIEAAQNAKVADGVLSMLAEYLNLNPNEYGIKPKYLDKSDTSLIIRCAKEAGLPPETAYYLAKAIMGNEMEEDAIEVCARAGYEEFQIQSANQPTTLALR